eukprot:s312_g32.t1
MRVAQCRVILFFTCRFILSLLPGNTAEVVAPAVVYGCTGIALILYISLRTFGRVDVFLGTGEDLKRVYRQMATAQRAPSPPLWAFGGNWQFVPWIVYNLLSSTFFPLVYESQVLTVTGLQDKSKPESESNQRCMEDDVIVNYFPPVEKSNSSSGCSLPRDAPVIIVEPGLTCTAQDVPGSSFLRRAVTRGFRIVVVERRGHGRKLRGPRWNLFGDSDDSEQIIRAVQERTNNAPMFWIGFSSGSKLPIEAVGKYDERRKNGDLTAPKFVATACIAPGYNLETCFNGFKFPYSWLCLSSTKSKFLLENEQVLRAHHPAAYEAAVNSSDLQELLSHVVPFAGYSSDKDYFAHENPVLFAPLVQTPTLVVNAMDDPLTVPSNAFGKMPGREDGATFADMICESTCGLLLMAPSGSTQRSLFHKLRLHTDATPQAFARLLDSSWPSFRDRLLQSYPGNDANGMDIDMKLTQHWATEDYEHGLKTSKPRCANAESATLNAGRSG